MSKKVIAMCLTVFILLSFIPTAVAASEWKPGQFAPLGDTSTWELKDGVVTISGSGSTYGTICGNGGVWGQKAKKVIIGSAITKIGDHQFCWSPSLEVFEVMPENQYYRSDSQGALYNKEMTILIRVPEGYKGVFIVPDTVKTIEREAFLFCKGLTKVEISTSVEYVGISAFYSCTGLKDVIYGGTEQKWQDIDIDIDNENLLNANIIYSSCNKDESTAAVGDVNKDGKINALDATQILRYCNSKSSVLADADEASMLAADVNKDGVINALDATQILRYCNGKASVFSK